MEGVRSTGAGLEIEETDFSSPDLIDDMLQIEEFTLLGECNGYIRQSN